MFYFWLLIVCFYWVYFTVFIERVSRRTLRLFSHRISPGSSVFPMRCRVSDVKMAELTPPCVNQVRAAAAESDVLQQDIVMRWRWLQPRNNVRITSHQRLHSECAHRRNLTRVVLSATWYSSKSTSKLSFTTVLCVTAQTQPKVRSIKTKKTS